MQNDKYALNFTLHESSRRKLKRIQPTCTPSEQIIYRKQSGYLWYKNRQTEKQADRQAERDYTELLRRSTSPTGKTQALKNHTWDKNGVVASKFQTHYWCHCRDRRRIHSSGVISYGEVHVHAQLPWSCWLMYQGDPVIALVAAGPKFGIRSRRRNNISKTNSFLVQSALWKVFRGLPSAKRLTAKHTDVLT